MTSTDRESVLKSLSESRERLLATVEGLTREQRQYRPAPGRWSVGEIVEHLTMVEKSVLGLVTKTLESAPDGSKRSAMGDEALVADVAGRITRFAAPEFVAPKGQLQDDELLSQFLAARENTSKFVTTSNADLRRHFFPHPIFGELDCYQWLLLLGAHCDRHRVQSEEVKASPGFPRAIAAS